MDDELEKVFKQWEKSEREYKESCKQKPIINKITIPTNKTYNMGFIKNTEEAITFMLYIFSLQYFMKNTNYPSKDYAIIMHLFLFCQLISYFYIAKTFTIPFHKNYPIYSPDLL